jgi:hypothetical protein
MSEEPRPTETDIAALAATVRAPESLHERAREMVDAAVERERQAKRSRALGIPRLRLAGVTTALAAIAAAIALTVAGGGSGTPALQQAMALTLSPARMAAPSESKLHNSQLDVAVEGVAFPYWEERFGWRSSGARVDQLAGRSVTTVFYSDAKGRRIGYAIVSGRAWANRGGTVIWRAGVPYRLLTHDGATVVAWPRAGHLCVIAGRDTNPATLLRLASWGARRSAT